MKKFIPFLFLLIISSGCYAQKLKTYVHPTDGYEIDIPNKWKIEEIAGLSLVAYDAQKNSSPMKNGAIHIEIQPFVIDSLDVVYEDYVNGLRTKSIVQELGEQIINGRKYKMYYELNSSGARPTKALVYLAMKDYKLFTVFFTTFQSEFDKLEPLFKKIATTLKY